MRVIFLLLFFFLTNTARSQLSTKDLDSCSRDASYFEKLIINKDFSLVKRDFNADLRKTIETFQKDSNHLARSIDTVYFNDREIHFILRTYTYSFNDKSLFEVLEKQVKELKYRKAGVWEIDGGSFKEYRQGPFVMRFESNSTSGQMKYRVSAHLSPK